ncbi:MAG: hypothetical protein H7X97_03475 [Opitutaceae bacterium]|nr:hypothetical protein [Verrucomicrobiales bacterium]
MKSAFSALTAKVLNVSALFVLIGGSMATDTLIAQTNAQASELGIPKSLFDERLKTGKDPFFPNSTRRSKTEFVPTPEVTTKVVAPQLVLKGTAGPASKRFALINNQTFAVGETQVVKFPGGQVKVTCVDIAADDSVTIMVEGQTEKMVLRLKD